MLSLFDPWLKQTKWRTTFAAASHVNVVGSTGAPNCGSGSQAVGVLEPGGHFVLVDLADGHSIADVQLKVRSEMRVTNLVVVRMGDQYIVLVQDRSGGGNNGNEMVQPPQGTSTSSAAGAQVSPSICRASSPGPNQRTWTRSVFCSTNPHGSPCWCFAASTANSITTRIACGPRWWPSTAVTAASSATRTRSAR